MRIKQKINIIKEKQIYKRILRTIKIIKYEYLPKIIEVIIYSSLIMLSLNLFGVIPLTIKTFIESIALYFIIEEIKYYFERR